MTAPQMSADGGEEFTELIDARFPRVDLVGKAANGTQFLIRKAADDSGLTQPLVAPEQVRALIAKADAQETPMTDHTPGDDVAKADAPVEADQLVPDAPAGSTASSLPGSPDWESLDSETAMGVVATLGRIKAALGWLADREAQEAVTGGDPDSGDNAFDLDDMACQIDCLIGRLAGFAVGEQMEAEVADELGQVGKAAAGATEHLEVLERLAPIAKAGRVLSASNEGLLRQAEDNIRQVLASLPAAPTVDDGQAVTKSEETQAVTEPTTEAPLTAADITKGARALSQFEAFKALLDGGTAVAKAKGDPAMAVFDANGKLVGVIDPSDLQPIAETAPPAEAEPAADEQPAEAAVEDAPAEAAPAAPEAQPAERVVPGTNTVQAPAEHDETPAVAKAAVATALEEVLTPLVEELRKHTELAEVVKGLQERVEKMGAQPDNRRSPVLNGATGTPGAVTRDGSAEDTELAAVRKAIAEETDPAKKTALAKRAFFDEVKHRFQG